MNNLENILTSTTTDPTLSFIFGSFLGFALIILIALIIWSLIWKGIALYKSARSGHKVWFIVFLIINTLGILEIIYIFLINRNKKKLEVNKEEIK